MRKLFIMSICCLIAIVASGQKITFDRSADILILQYDSKPDPDDIHAIAAAGSILAHPDFTNVNYYAVSGAYGKQTGIFMHSPALFDLAFGAGNWTDRDPNGDGTPESATAAATAIKNKVKPILQAGGKAWVCEAGQSDVTADWIAALIADGISEATIKTNVLVIQHSQWNEDQTTTADLNYVKDKAFFVAIDDGNASYGNTSWGDRGEYSTPEFRSTNSSYIASAKSSPIASSSNLWTKADEVIDTYYPGGYPHDWSHIYYDGVDFSDTAEIWFTLGMQGLHTVTPFWDAFVVAQGTVTIDPNAGVNPPEGPVAPTGSWIESGGMVVIEAEHIDIAGSWRTRPTTHTADPTMAGSLGDGWLEWGGAQYYGNQISDGAANGLITATVEIQTAGDYIFRWRTKQYNEGTFDAGNDTYAAFGSGTPVSGYQDFGTLTKIWVQSKTAWSWHTTWEPVHGVFYANGLGRRTLSAGTHTLKFAARSPNHAIDRIILHRTNITFNEATFNSAPESVRAGASETFTAITDFTLSPAADGRTVYYVDTPNNALAIDAANVSNRGKFARAEMTFSGAAGNYDVVVKALQETDGECVYRLLINGVVVGTATNSTTSTDYNPQDHTFSNVVIPTGATIAVESNTDSNGLIPEGGGFAWARGRWRSLTLTSRVGGTGMTVNAGNDQTLVLPVTQFELVGTATDDGAIASVLWTQVSGPTTATLTGATQTNVTVSGVVSGTYVFRLTATDDEANILSDDVEIDIVSSVLVYEDNFSSYSGSINGANWNPKWDGGSDQQSLMLANSGFATLDTVIARDNYHVPCKHGFSLEDGQHAVVGSDFRYRHMAGGDATIELNKPAFSMILGAADNWWTGPKMMFNVCNRGTGIGAVNSTGGDVVSHTSLGVDTTAGGYSDWFRIEWTIARGAANYTGQAVIKDNVGTVLYTGTVDDLGIVNGTTVYGGYSTGGDGWNATTTNISSFSKFDQLNMDNFKIEVFSPAKVGFERFEEDYALTLGMTGDDDGDGLANLYEYAIGGDPTNSSMYGIEPTLTINTDGNAFYNVAELTDPARGVRYIVQARTNLTEGSWATLFENGQFTNTINGVSGMEEVQHRFWVGSGASDEKFLRLVIEVE